MASATVLVPVICSSFTFAREKVKQDVGWIFRRGDVNGLYQALKESLTCREARDRMMIQAHRTAQNWSWETVGAMYWRVIWACVD